MRLNLALLTGLLSVAASADLLKQPIPGAVAPGTAPSTTVVDGVRVTMVSAVSKLDAEALRAHYTALFEQQGLYLADEVRDITLQNSLQVTGVDTDRMISYTVLLQKGGKGFTTVIASQAELAKQPVPANASFAPILPGAQGVTTAMMEGMQTLTYSTVATPAEVKTYYREQLAKMGFKETEGLLFAKDNERISLVISPGLSLRGVMLVREFADGSPEPAPAPSRADAGR